MLRSTTILNQQGDTTIIWTEENDDEMEKIIRQKMKEGVTFWLIEPRAFGMLPPRKEELKNHRDAFRKRALSIGDKDFAKFVGEGRGTTVKSPESNIEKSKKSDDPKEVAKSQSVAVKPVRGG